MTPWIKETIVMLDVETTGLHETARIVQMASVMGIAGQIVRGRVAIVDPGEPIPESATAIHGVTNERVKGAPTFASLAPAVHERIHAGVPAAYNAPFDRRRFAYELSLVGLDVAPTVWLDPLPWVRRFDGPYRGNTLVKACGRRGIVLRAHDALADAHAALKLLYLLAPKLPTDLEELRGETEQIRAVQDAEREEYFARKRANEAAPSNDPAPTAKEA